VSTILQHCPEPGAIESAIAAGGPQGALAEHLERCDACREQAQTIRENLRFMRGLLGKLGVEAVVRAVSRSDQPPVAPDLVPGYRITREVAHGGQGAVYEAIQDETKRRVAIKIVDPGPPGGHGARRFEREVELAASLRHPNIVSIYHSVTLADGRHALVMEFVDGLRIDEWAATVDAATPPTPEARRDAVRLKLRAIATICDAVQHAHVNGVIHRDLKPANVLVSPDGTVRVVDFGIARRVSHATQLTRTGSFAGTLAYASPEQVSGKSGDVDTRTDVYALGLLLYEVLAERRPYDTDGSLSGAIASIVNTPAPRLEVIQPGNQPAGAELEAIVQKALAKDRAERYQSAIALRNDIENYLAGRAVEARLHSTVYVLRKMAARHRVGFAAALGVVVLLAVFAVFMTWSSRRLAHQRELLAASLASSTVERGRSVGRSGENYRAEELLWPEVHRAGVDPHDPELLFASPPGVTQVAWALCELYSRHPTLARFRGPPGAAMMGFEPDGQTLRLLCTDGTQELRSSTSGALVERLAPADTPPHTSDTLVPGAWGYAMLSDAGTATCHRGTGRTRWYTPDELPPHIFREMSHDGSRMLTLDRAGELMLWATEPPAPIATLARGVSTSSKPCFTPDGRWVIAGVGREILRWRADNGAPDRAWSIPDALMTQAIRVGIYAVRLSPDARRLAVGYGGSLLLFDAEDPRASPVEVRGAHRGFTAYLAFSADGRTLLSSGNERNLRIWDPSGAALLGSFEHGRDARVWPAISGDGSRVAIIDQDDVVSVFESRGGGWLARLTEPSHTVHKVAFSPDGTLLAAVSSDGSARLWKRADRTLLWELSLAPTSLEAVCFSPDGRTIALADAEGQIYVFDVAAPGAHRRLATGPRLPSWLGFSPDGRSIVCTGYAEQIYVFDAADGRLQRELVGHRGRVIEAVFSPDGRTLYSVSADGRAIAWDWASGKERFRTEPCGSQIRAVAVTPDGRTLITGSDDWMIRLWNAATGEALDVITGPRQQIFGLAVHPRGSLLISCGRDSTLQVWDLRTRRELAVLEGHRDMVLSLALSPDGHTLATASVDRSVGVWDLRYYQRHLAGNAEFWRGRVPAR
jgi:WD40 repeat protein